MERVWGDRRMSGALSQDISLLSRTHSQQLNKQKTALFLFYSEKNFFKNMYFSLIAKLKTQLSPKINVTAKSWELNYIKIKTSLEVNKQPEPGGLGIHRALLTLHRPFWTPTTLHPYGCRRGHSAVPPAPLLMKLMTIHASHSVVHFLCRRRFTLMWPLKYVKKTGGLTPWLMIFSWCSIKYV